MNMRIIEFWWIYFTYWLQCYPIFVLYSYVFLVGACDSFTVRQSTIFTPLNLGRVLILPNLVMIINESWKNWGFALTVPVFIFYLWALVNNKMLRFLPLCKLVMFMSQYFFFFLLIWITSATILATTIRTT